MSRWATHSLILPIPGLEILWAFGIAAMERFTAAYQALMTIDYANLPYWDLVMALRPAFKIAEWAGDAILERQMRERHHQFVQQALAKI